MESNKFIVMGGKNDRNEYRRDAWMFSLDLFNEVTTADVQGWSQLDFPVSEDGQIDDEFADL